MQYASYNQQGDYDMKKTILIIVAVLVFAGVAGYVAFKPSASQDQQAYTQAGADNSAHNKPHTHDDSHPHDEAVNAGQVQSGTVTMDIKNFDFEKQKITVKPGTTVTWINRDEAKHDVNPDKKSPDFVGSGQLLAKGESYSYTFEKPGVYTYHCTPHPYMQASVEVVE